jgi:drug/metabolite transporter superfamily protein YnfA
LSATSTLARGSVKWLEAVACALAFAHPARAEAPPSAFPPSSQAPSNELERPRLLDAADVPYPQGASGDASVVLELLIERDGTVAEARMESGMEPFASAAQLAAPGFRFAPARRAGKPVAARIRLELKFTDPENEQTATERAVDAEAGPESGQVRSGSAAEPHRAPVEIVVQGDERPPARRSFSRAEVRQLPGAFGDPFRAIEAMPGVTPIVSGFPFFYVRGAPPGNVGYFFDGIRVPYLYHFGLGPGVIHPSMIERVDLYAGGYPARYGRYAGAIVAGEMSKPYGELRGEASVRLIDAGAMLEAPFAEGRGTAALAGRYSYTAALLSLFADDVVLDYWDYQGRATYQIGARDQLTLFGFGAYDYLGEVGQDGRAETLAGTEFHRLDLRLDRQVSKGSALRLAVTLGLDRTRSGSDGSEEFSVVDRSIGARVELRSQLDQRARFVAGLDFALDAFELNLDSVSDDDVNIGLWEQDDFATGLHAELQLEAAPRVELTPGVRVDVYTSGSARALAVEPRVSAKFSITPKLRLIHTLGVAHQPPGFVVPVPGFRIAGLRGGLQRSWQESAGFEADLPDRISLSLTLFQNVAFNLADPLTALKAFDEVEDSEPPPSQPPTQIVDPEPPEERSRPTRLETRALGHSVGFELLLKRRLSERLGGFLAYTLSRSVRSFDRVSAMSGWDRTHVLSLALAYDLGRRWRAGTRVTYYTGIPATVETPELQSQSPRTDAFHRIDARLEKKWLLGSRGAWIALLIEMLNATLREEEVERRCEDSGCTSERVGPIAVPSLGVEAQF